MKILTLNTWQESGPWKERWDVILKGVKALDPDIVGFQETFNGKWFEEMLARSGYAHGLYFQDDCGQSLWSKLPIQASHLHRFENQAPSEPDYIRYVIHADLDAGNGKSLHFFNTHLAWKTDEAETRTKQVMEMIDYIDEVAGTEEAVSVGDFNADDNTAAIRKMMTLGKFNDMWAVRHPKERGLTWDNRNPYAAGGTVMPDRRLDYIFVRNNSNLLAHVESCNLVFTEPNEKGIYATDHYGLLATFRGKDL